MEGFIRSVFDDLLDIQFILKASQLPLRSPHSAHVFLIRTGFQPGDISRSFYDAFLDRGISSFVAGKDEVMNGLAFGTRIRFSNDFAVEFIDNSIIDESKILQLKLKGLKVSASDFVGCYSGRSQGRNGKSHFFVVYHV